MQIRICIAVLLTAVASTSHGDAGVDRCDPELTANAGGVEALVVEPFQFDARIAVLLNEFGLTPGLAVGVVRDDQVLYARGFGYRDLATCAPVTADTLFYLLSVTKSFTGMVAALLQDQGAWELDKSLGEYYPGLTMSDGINPNQISMRDLLVHRPGFRNAGINYRTFGPGNAEDADVMYLLEHYSEPLPIQFRYTNMGYVVAAMVMTLQTGKPWTALLEEMIFEPLGMSKTTTSIDRAVAGDFAKPYRMDGDGQYQAMPVKTQEQMHAAGGVASSVSDLLRWVRVNLALGQLDGEVVFDDQVVRQVHSPQIQYEWQYYLFNRFGYGLGVHNADYDGDLLIHHFGGPIHVSFMPEHGIGVVVLTNGSGPSTAFSHMIGAFLYDTLLEKPDTEKKFDAEVLALRERALERIAVSERADKTLRDGRVRSITKQDAAVYAGRYLSDRLGEISVGWGKGELQLEFGVYLSPMEYVGDDTFLVRLSADGQLEEFRFVSNEGAVVTLDWGGRLFERVEP